MLLLQSSFIILTPHTSITCIGFGLYPDTSCEPPHDKTNKVTVRPAKTLISLGIRPVWSESSLRAQWVVKDPSFLHADSEDSDRTGRMPRLIWVFAGRTLILLVLSWGGSCYWSQLLKHLYDDNIFHLFGHAYLKIIIPLRIVIFVLRIGKSQSMCLE